jgi:hypothetical protein
MSGLKVRRLNALSVCNLLLSPDLRPLLSQLFPQIVAIVGGVLSYERTQSAHNNATDLPVDE